MPELPPDARTAFHLARTSAPVATRRRRTVHVRRRRRPVCLAEIVADLYRRHDAPRAPAVLDTTA